MQNVLDPFSIKIRKLLRMGDYDLGPNETSMYDFWQVCRMRNLIKTEAANGSVLCVLKKI